MADSEQGAASASGSREDPNKVADEVVNNLKSQGLFDQFRKECLEELESVEAYRLLKQRVENHVASFLSKYRWSEKMSKNNLRNNLRMNINRSEVLLNGIDRLVDQILASRSDSFADRIGPEVDKYLGIDKDRDQTPENDTMEVEQEFCETNVLPSTSKYHDAKPPQSLSLQLEGKITNFSPTASFLPPEQTFIDPSTDYGSPKMIESLIDRKFAESKVASSSWGMQSFQGSPYESTAGFAQKEEILQAWQTSNAPSQLQSNISRPREVSLVSNKQSSVGLDEGYATKQERKDSELKARIAAQYIAAQEHIKKQSMGSNNAEGITNANDCSGSDKFQTTINACVDKAEPCIPATSIQRSGGPVTSSGDVQVDLNGGASNDQMCLNRKNEQLPEAHPSESPVEVINTSANEAQNSLVADGSALKCDIVDKERDNIVVTQKQNSARGAEASIETNPTKAAVEIAECHVSRRGTAQESVIDTETKAKETDRERNANSNSLQEEVFTMNETDNCISYEEFKKKKEKSAKAVQVGGATVEGKREISGSPGRSVDEEKFSTADDTLEEHDIYAMLEEAIDKEECYAKKKQGATSVAKEGKKEVLKSLRKDHKEKVENSIAVKEESSSAGSSAGVEAEKDHALGPENSDQKESIKQDSITKTHVQQQCERIASATTEIEQDRRDHNITVDEEMGASERNDKDSVLQRPNDSKVQKELFTDRDGKERNSNDSFEDKNIDTVREANPEGHAICRTDAEANKEDIETVPKPEITKESTIDRELSYDPISPIAGNAATAESQVELPEQHEQNLDHRMQTGQLDLTTESVVVGTGVEEKEGRVEADVVSQTSSEGDSKKDESLPFASEGNCSSTAQADLQLGVGQRRVKRRKRLISESGGQAGKEAKTARSSDPIVADEDKLKSVTSEENTAEVGKAKKQRGRPKKPESTKSDSQPPSDCDMPEDMAEEKQDKGAAVGGTKPKKGRGRPKGTKSAKSDSLPSSDCEMPHDDQEASHRDRSRSRSRRADEFDNIRGIDRQRSVGSESNASDTCVEGKDVETRRTRRQIRPKRCYSPSDSK